MELKKLSGLVSLSVRMSVPPFQYSLCVGLSLHFILLNPFKLFKLYGTFKPFRFYFVLLFSVPFVVQKLSSEIVQKTKVCANIFKECKGMEDEAVAYIDR